VRKKRATSRYDGGGVGPRKEGDGGKIGICIAVCAPQISVAVVARISNSVIHAPTVAPISQDICVKYSLILNLRGRTEYFHCFPFPGVATNR